jgi:hypothetical protein
VARYNVLESIYQSWEGMSLEQAYEDSVELLCTRVLKHLAQILKLYTNPAPNPSSSVTEALDVQFNQILDADRICRNFTVTIHYHTPKSVFGTAEDLSDDDEDSDCTEKNIRNAVNLDQPRSKKRADEEPPGARNPKRIQH